jgi:hypothetical protein
VSWVKLDDGFADHPKVLALDDRAFRWFVWSLCYSARQLTDGFVPLGVLRGGPLVTRKYTFERALRVLRGAGLWHEVDGGIQIHDYLDYNPNRAQTLKRREKQLERWHRWKERNEPDDQRDTNAVSGEATNATPDPTRVNNPQLASSRSETTSEQAAAEEKERQDQPFTDGFGPERLDPGSVLEALREKERPAKKGDLPF